MVSVSYILFWLFASFDGLVIATRCKSPHSPTSHSADRYWWFLYKNRKNPHDKTYSYYDNHIATDWNRRPQTNPLDHANSALVRTLKDMYINRDYWGFFPYSSRDVSTGITHSDAHAHANGILAWDHGDNDGFWIISSLPQFPYINVWAPGAATGHQTFPPAADNNGQTFFCITLTNIADFHNIAQVLWNIRAAAPTGNKAKPRADKVIYHPNAGVSRYWRALVNQNWGALPTPAPHGNLPIHIGPAVGGWDFRYFWKTKDHLEDIFRDISTHYTQSFKWQTWRNGQGTPQRSFCGVAGVGGAGNLWQTEQINVHDIHMLSAAGGGGPANQWQYTTDHSKVGIGKNPAVATNDYHVCVGDLNRMYSMRKRSGGYLCFVHQRLWNGLNNALVELAHPDCEYIYR
eukprot:200662_1